jgi:transposase
MLVGIRGAIDEKWTKQRRRLYLVGVAKHNAVLARYQLAMALEGILACDYPAYVEIDRWLEEKAYVWSERWVVERTISWLHQYRRLRVRYERRADIHEAFLQIAGCLICLKLLKAEESF